MNILQAKKKLPSDQRTLIEQANFAYSPLAEAFKKHTKTIEDQGKKTKGTEEQGKQLVESKEEIILILTEMVCHLKNRKKYLVNFSKKGLLNLINEAIKLILLI